MDIRLLLCGIHKISICDFRPRMSAVCMSGILMSGVSLKYQKKVINVEDFIANH